MACDVERRRFVQLAGLTSLTGLLSGCPFWRPTSPANGNALRTLDTASKLTIDVHCHFFNGSDLPLFPFATKVLRHSGDFPAWAQSFAPLIQSVNWNLAPDARAEMDLLNRMRGVGREDSHQLLLQKRTEAHRRGVNELKTKAKTLIFVSGMDLGESPERDPTLATILSLTGDYDTDVLQHMKGKGEQPLKTKGVGKEFLLSPSPDYRAGLIFFEQLFQYRTTNLLTYLDTYSPGQANQIDLVVPSVVDFDVWLGGRDNGKTSIDDQVSILEKLAIVTQGRVHGMVPYDPLRDIVEGGASLRRVQESVLTRGCMGVKIYPPMGFAPFGNAHISAKDWPWRKAKVQGLPDIAYHPDFGAKLDGAMTQFFTFCRSHEIPILAHTSLSNGQTDSLQELAGANYWREAIEQFPGLRIDFGHFGGSAPAADESKYGYKRPEEFLKIMKQPGAGDGLFADTGYFLEVLKSDGALRKRLIELMQESGDLAAQRLMYGTDWLMNCGMKGMGNYRNAFEQLTAEVESSVGASGVYKHFGDAFFGTNAARFFGLEKGDRTRLRLEQFYAKNNIPTPTWATKIDRQVNV